jgi:hypothetical protein
LLINLFVAVSSVGAHVVIANFIGRKKKDAVRRSVNTVGLLAISSRVLLLVIGVLAALAPYLKRWARRKKCWPQAVLYLRLFLLRNAIHDGLQLRREHPALHRRHEAAALHAGGRRRGQHGAQPYFVISLKWGVAGVATRRPLPTAWPPGSWWRCCGREVDPLRLRPKRLAHQPPELGKNPAHRTAGGPAGRGVLLCQCVSANHHQHVWRGRHRRIGSVAERMSTTAISC